MQHKLQSRQLDFKGSVGEITETSIPGWGNTICGTEDNSSHVQIKKYIWRNNRNKLRIPQHVISLSNYKQINSHIEKDDG